MIRLKHEGSASLTEVFVQATFIGFGPDFKVNQTSQSFRNVELYNLMCQLMDIKPAKNNGERQVFLVQLVFLVTWLVSSLSFYAIFLILSLRLGIFNIVLCGGFELSHFICCLQGLLSYPLVCHATKAYDKCLSLWSTNII